MKEVAIARSNLEYERKVGETKRGSLAGIVKCDLFDSPFVSAVIIP